LKFLNPFLVVTLASIPAGWITGQTWLLGNLAANAGVWWLVVLGIPSNLVIAAIYYFLLRGAVYRADGGVGLLIVLMAVNLVVSLGAASWVAGAIGAGAAVKLGAHAFSWGMTYAYGQAIHDVHRGTWLHM
jgi:hypothetical protein